MKDNDNFIGDTIRKVNLIIDKIDFDSIQIDASRTSFIGSLQIYKNGFLFVDNQFCWVFRYDANGKQISRNIGQGNAPSQLPCKHITAYIPLRNGGHMFIGQSWDVYNFDSNFQKTSDYRIDWHPRGNKEYVAQNPDPSDPIMYSPTLGLQQIRADDDYVYLPLFSQHKLFNPMASNYAKDARLFGRMNIKKGDVDQIYGRLSSIYTKNRNANIFPYPIYDLLEKNEYVVSFPVDSLIYIYKKDFSIKSIFGKSGRSMNTNYNFTFDYNKFSSVMADELKEKGYYTAIDYIEEKNLLFRSYQKNGNANDDGLQIYQNEVLIADVDIPKKQN